MDVLKCITALFCATCVFSLYSFLLEGQYEIILYIKKNFASCLTRTTFESSSKIMGKIWEKEGYRFP